MVKRECVTEENIDDLIGDWHDSDKITVTLWEYLGWTKEEYARWVETDEFPK